MSPNCDSCGLLMLQETEFSGPSTMIRVFCISLSTGSYKKIGVNTSTRGPIGEVVIEWETGMAKACQYA
jgi:hypothetical protein